MATIRSVNALLTELFHDGQAAGSITASDVRDMIASIEARTPITVSVKEYGAVGDGVTDDRAAIQAAIDAFPTGDVTIFFPKGTYSVPTKHPTVSAPKPIFNVAAGQDNVHFVGEGMDVSTIRVPDGTVFTGDTHHFALRGVSNISFRNMTMDGNYSNVTYVGGEQAHGIWIFESSRVVVENVRFYQLRGDGIFMVTDSAEEDGTGTWVEDIIVSDCQFDDCNRNGASHQGGRRLSYVNNVFVDVNNAALDFETTGSRPGVRDVVVIGNNIKIRDDSNSLCASFTGQGDSQAQRFVVVGNVFNGAGIQFGMCIDSVFTGNIIINETTQPAMWFVGDIHRTVVTGNSLIQIGTVSATAGAIRSTLTGVTHIQDLLFAGNFVDMRSGGRAIFLDPNFNRITIRGNVFKGPGTGFAGSRAIYLNTATADSPVTGIVITENVFHGWETDTAAGAGSVTIRRSSAATNSLLSDVVISRNTWHSMITGNAIGLSSALERITRLTIADNHFGGGLTGTISQSPSGEKYVIGGNAGGVAEWAGTGTPEGVVTAPVGSRYLRTDGGVGTTMYLKQAGTGNTGWDALS